MYKEKPTITNGFNQKKVTVKHQVVGGKSKIIPYPEYMLLKDGVYKKEEQEDGKNKISYVCDFIDITEQAMKMETNHCLLTLVYRLPNEETLHKKEVYADQISDISKISSFSKYGFNIHSYNKGDVLKHLQNCRVKLPISYKHSSLGFDLINGEAVFKHYKMFGPNLKVESVYDGELTIAPKGSFEQWSDLIKKEVLGHTPLELAVVMGLTSATCGFISKELSLENIVINLFNDSSTGKTTASQLAASVFGSPVLKDNGLVMSWNSTFNAMQNKIAGNTGVVVVFDEASMSRNDDFSKAIYSLAEGKETARMDKEGTVKKSSVWNTLLISTAEKSLFESSNNNSGLRVRLIEFGNVVWTKSAQNSDEIKRVISANYGHAGPLYAQYLMKLGKKKVAEGILCCQSLLRQKLPNSDLADRVSMKLALLLFTAELSNQRFKWNLNIEKMTEFLAKNESDKLKVGDIAQQALERVFAYISIKIEHFDREFKTKANKTSGNDYIKASHGDVWGKIIYVASQTQGSPTHDSTYEVMVNKEIMDKILKDLNYESPNVVIKKWKQKGWLNTEKGKTYRKRVLNRIVATFIVFDLKNIDPLALISVGD